METIHKKTRNIRGLINRCLEEICNPKLDRSIMTKSLNSVLDEVSAIDDQTEVIKEVFVILGKK